MVSKNASMELGRDLKDFIAKLKANANNPEAVNEAAKESIDQAYQTMPDGADAESGDAVGDSQDQGYTEAKQVIENTDHVKEPEKVAEAAFTQIKHDLKAEQKMVPPVERASATPKTVKEKIFGYPVGDQFGPGVFKRIFSGNAPETEETRKARYQAAMSKRTDVKPAVEAIRYEKNTCESQGKTINYKVLMQGVDWGKMLRRGSYSTEEAIDKIIGYMTDAVRACYGGWGRITEIIVRDQQLIINRSCFRPVLDDKSIDISLFPLDTLDYIKAGAFAAFFDWRKLKSMTNLRVLDIDDMGFFVTNIGGSLKCGRRIGVSSIFNLCKSLEILIIGDDSTTREELSSKKGISLKKRVADHKRHALFSDGYRLEICKGTSMASKWMVGNLKSYATNRGNKGIFRFCGGVAARLAGSAFLGLINRGTHLVGGIRDVFREASTPVDESDVGMK